MVLRNRWIAIALITATVAAAIGPMRNPVINVHAAGTINGYDVITEYTTSAVGPIDIVAGPDGNLWYGASTGGCDPSGCGVVAELVKVDPGTGSTLNTYSIGCIPYDVVIGRDHNLWADAACLLPGDFTFSSLVRVTTAGVVTSFSLPSDPHNFGRGPGQMINGPDGDLWVISYPDRNSVFEVDVTTGAVVAEHPFPAGAAGLASIAVGSDGNVWFTEANRIGRMTTSGSITEFALKPNTTPAGIIAGSDGNLYFTETGAGIIGMITTSGAVTEFPLAAGANPSGLRVSADGNLWFSDGSKIGSITRSGATQEVSLPTAGSTARSLAPGPDGNLWFVENRNAIGKLGTRHNVLVLDKTGIGFGDVPIDTTPATQRITLTNNGPGTLAAFQPSIRGLSTSSGSFTIATDTCHTAAIASGSSCYLDVQFAATSNTGTASGTAVFDVDAGLPTEQTLTAGLSAVVIGAACLAASISTDLSSPQNVGSNVTLRASSTGCPHPNPLYSFYLRSPQGVWSVVQSLGTATTYVWQTAGYPQGTYQIGVAVKDTESGNSPDASGFGTFTLGLPSCGSTSMTSDVVSPEVVGTTVHLSASSSGCPNPLYQWWVRDTVGSWAIAVPFGASNTFSWNTAGLTEGTYQLGVWAKQQFSGSSYDAFAIVTYTLTVSHCGSVSLVTDLSSFQATGATIMLTAAAASCPGPQYRFWVRDPAGTWHIVQDFSSTATYQWNPSSVVSTSNPGTYLLGVWAVQPGSNNSYDAFFILTFALTSGSTCTVTAASDKTSPQTAGTLVNWTATPGGGCNAAGIQLQFWVNPPGGVWTIAQPFSNGSPNFAWTASSGGTYQIGVWVKQAASSAGYDDFAITTFTLTPTTPAQVCSAVAVTPGVASPQPISTAISFTATPIGCSAPQLQWWVRDTNASWAVALDFAHSNTSLTWSTNGLAPGTYLVGVWARQAGSAASYEAYSFTTYTLTAPPPQVCSSANLSETPPSPGGLGYRITFTATSVGCNLPDYRFLVAPQGGLWSEAQAYGSNNQFIWYAPQGAGLYLIGLWVRQLGSTASYEAYALTSFQVLANTCLADSLWPADNGTTYNSIPVAAMQPAGTHIGWISPITNACDSSRYQFLVRAPGSPDTVVQPYGIGINTFQWNTAGLALGTYQVTIQARVSYSGPPDAFAVTSYQVI